MTAAPLQRTDIARTRETDPRDRYRVAGRALRLRDGLEKITGRARYAADMMVPGMLHARLVLSPHPHARIVSIDSTRALQTEGIVQIVTGAELTRSNTPPSSRSQALLAVERVVFAGQPVAVVLAETEAAAEDGIELVDVDYEILPAVVDLFSAMVPGAPLVWPGGAEVSRREAGVHGGDVGDKFIENGNANGNVTSVVRYQRGDVDLEFRAADIVLEREYRSHVVHQGYLEPHAAAAACDAFTGEVTVWTSTQGSFFVRAEVAGALDLHESQVRIIPTAIGGGFGAKIVLLEPLVAALARLVGRPVRLVLTRMEDFLSATPAPQQIMRLKVGATRDGRLTALQARLYLDSGAFSGTPVVLAGLIVGWSYRFTSLDIESTEVLTHKTPVGAYRAPGATPTVFAIESHVDDLARALGIDPVEFRLKNLIGGDDVMPDGTPWPPLGLRACLERLRDHRLWQDRTPAPWVGVGVGLSPWRGGIEPAAAVCRLDEDGAIQVVVGSVDITGAHTTLALIAAETLRVDADRVRVVASDTTQAPYAGVTGGSKLISTVGLAVERAAADARQQLLQIAASLLEANVEDLELVDGDVRVRGVPGTAMPMGDIARLTMRYGSKHPPVFGRGIVAPTDRASGSAAHLARVGVDPETGQVQVLDYLAVQDVGFAINPPAVIGQIVGGVAQGIGWALYERVLYDDAGHPLTTTFADYVIPSSMDIPRITVELVEIPLPHTPLGARGVGEPPVVPVAGAIANAVRDATGVRVTEIPIVPSQLLRSLSVGAGGGCDEASE